MNIPTTREFEDWFQNDLTLHQKKIVNGRLERIRKSDHFGDARPLGDELFELKWRNGLRVYFCYIEDDAGQAALMLLGGDKNGQNRDIAKARAVLARETA